MLDERNNGLDAKAIIKKIEKERRNRKLQNRKRICAIVSFVSIVSASAINAHALSAHSQNNAVQAEVQTTELQNAPTDNSVESIKKDVVPAKTTNIAVEAVTKTVDNVQPVVEQVKNESSVKKDESIYNKNIPMPKAQQEYLYKLCKERGLDYKDTLSILKNESQFDPNCISNRDYGYFQINKVNHADLAKTLKTANEALDPYVNINWGTYMLSNLYRKWENKGYSGEGLNNIVWSEYNEGTYGLKKWGLANEYIRRVNTERKFIDSIF